MIYGLDSSNYLKPINVLRVLKVTKFLIFSIVKYSRLDKKKSHRINFYRGKINFEINVSSILGAPRKAACILLSYNEHRFVYEFTFLPFVLPTLARWAKARFNSQRAIAISRGGKGAETCARASRTRSMRHKRLIYLTHPRRRRRPSAVCTKERRVTTLSVPLFKTNNQNSRTFRL